MFSNPQFSLWEHILHKFLSFLFLGILRTPSSCDLSVVLLVQPLPKFYRHQPWVVQWRLLTTSQAILGHGPVTRVWGFGNCAFVMSRDTVPGQGRIPLKSMLCYYQNSQQTRLEFRFCNNWNIETGAWEKHGGLCPPCPSEKPPSESRAVRNLWCRRSWPRDSRGSRGRTGKRRRADCRWSTRRERRKSFDRNTSHRTACWRPTDSRACRSFWSDSDRASFGRSVQPSSERLRREPDNAHGTSRPRNIRAPHHPLKPNDSRVL